MLWGPANVIADEQVQQAVTIVIEPECRGAEGLPRAQAASACHVKKGSIAGVTEESVLPDAGDENIREAVVVVVADRDAHSVHLGVQAGGFGHIRESSVAIVLVEPQCGEL